MPFSRHDLQSPDPKLLDFVRRADKGDRRLGDVHGLAHWARVRSNGHAIADANPEVDRKVVDAFALLHDVARRHDKNDPNHGPRAAKLAAGLGEVGYTPEQIHQVQQACGGHTHRMFHHDPTVAACWDSDRLDLGRVGIDPNPDRLHSDRARELLDAAHERASGEHRPAWIDEKHSLNEMAAPIRMRAWSPDKEKEWTQTHIKADAIMPKVRGEQAYDSIPHGDGVVTFSRSANSLSWSKKVRGKTVAAGHGEIIPTPGAHTYKEESAAAAERGTGVYGAVLSHLSKSYHMLSDTEHSVGTNKVWHRTFKGRLYHLKAGHQFAVAKDGSNITDHFLADDPVPVKPLSEAYGAETSKSGFEGEKDEGPSDSDKAKVADIVNNASLPDKAEDGKAYVVHWADGRGIFAVRNKASLSKWLDKVGAWAEIVSIKYKEPIQGDRKLRVTEDALTHHLPDVSEAKMKVTPPADVVIPQHWFHGSENQHPGIHVGKLSRFAYYTGATPDPIKQPVPKEFEDAYHAGHIRTLSHTYGDATWKVPRNYNGHQNFGRGVYLASHVERAREYGDHVIGASINPNLVLAAKWEDRNTPGTTMHAVMSHVHSMAGVNMRDQAAVFYKAVKKVDRTKKALYIHNGGDHGGQLAVYDPSIIHDMASAEYYPRNAEGEKVNESTEVSTVSPSFAFKDGVEHANKFQQESGPNMKAILSVNPYLPGSGSHLEWAAGFKSVIPDAPCHVDESVAQSQSEGPGCPVCDAPTVLTKHSETCTTVGCEQCGSWLDFLDGAVIPIRSRCREYTCPKCGSHDAYAHEAHADTGYDEMEGRCRACRYSDDLDKFCGRTYLDKDKLAAQRAEWKERGKQIDAVNQFHRDLKMKLGESKTEPFTAEMFHGTRHAFDTFTAEPHDNFGHWFTDDKDLASTYASVKDGPDAPHVVKATVTLRNPHRMTHEQYDNLRSTPGAKSEKLKALRTRLMSRGHDGIVIPAEVEKLSRTSIRHPAIVAAFHGSAASKPERVTENKDIATPGIKPLTAPPKSKAAYLDGNEYHREVGSGRTDKPKKFSKYKVGTWRRDPMKLNYGHAIEELRNVPIADLETPETPGGKLHPSKRGDDEEYAGRLKAGHEAPPIEVVQTEAGRLRVTDGHRRVLAHKRVGHSHIKAWVSYSVEHPEGTKDAYGKPMYVGLTHEIYHGSRVTESLINRIQSFLDR